MKKLFLASNASTTLEKLTEILPREPSGLKLAFIPTAADRYQEKEWLWQDRAALIKLGFQVKDVSLAGKTKIQLAAELADIDVIFVAGGNTFYLLSKAKDSGFDQLIPELIEKGVVYVGSSAGSVLVCPTIEFVAGLDDPAEAPGLTNYQGLNLINYLIMPHWGDSEYAQLYPEIYETWKKRGYEIKRLTNNQALIINETKTYQVEV